MLFSAQALPWQVAALLADSCIYKAYPPIKLLHAVLALSLSSFSMSEALSILLRGDGNCAEVAWQFLGISIPGWAAIGFIGLTIAWLIQLRQ